MDYQALPVISARKEIPTFFVVIKSYQAPGKKFLTTNDLVAFNTPTPINRTRIIGLYTKLKSAEKSAKHLTKTSKRKPFKFVA